VEVHSRGDQGRPARGGIRRRHGKAPRPPRRRRR
jgi:hypothetical protein